MFSLVQMYPRFLTILVKDGVREKKLNIFGENLRCDGV